MQNPDSTLPFDWKFVAYQISSDNLSHPYIEQCVRKLSRIVCFKYFGFMDESFREELIEEGVVKSFQLFGTSHFDLSKPIKPFLMAGMRNSMSNFKRKNTKEVSMPEFVESSEPGFVETKSIWDSFSIEWECMERVFAKFSKKFLSFIPLVAGALELMGFALKGFPISVLQAPVPEVAVSLQRDVERFTSLIIWEKMEFAF